MLQALMGRQDERPMAANVPPLGLSNRAIACEYLPIVCGPDADLLSSAGRVGEGTKLIRSFQLCYATNRFRRLDASTVRGAIARSYSLARGTVPT